LKDHEDNVIALLNAIGSSHIRIGGATLLDDVDRRDEESNEEQSPKERIELEAAVTRILLLLKHVN
jgi:hypothetical protein